MTIELLLAAAGGGIFGALIGALPVFILTGFVALAGNVLVAVGADIDILGGVAFGGFLGPHIAFAGGVAATAWAHRYDELEAGGDITAPLAQFNSYKPLLVGAIFGMMGYMFNYLYATVLELPTDTVAMSVITTAIIVRILIGKSGITGKCNAEKRAYFPDKMQIPMLIIMGLGIGFVVSQMTVVTGLVTLGFAVSAASLIFTQTGFPVPATHHISLVAAFAASTTGDVYIGALFGMVAALWGEVLARTFNSYCDSHIDPPAFTIFTLGFIILGFM